MGEENRRGICSDEKVFRPSLVSPSRNCVYITSTNDDHRPRLNRCPTDSLASWSPRQIVGAFKGNRIQHILEVIQKGRA